MNCNRCGDPFTSGVCARCEREMQKKIAGHLAEQRRIIDDPTLRALTRLLAYCEQEEKENYESAPSRIHIYNDIERLRKWVDGVRDNGDPLLFIEAISNAETRTFVRRALTYAWIYAARLGRRPPGLDALVAGEFPRFTGAAQPGTLTLVTSRIH